MKVAVEISKCDPNKIDVLFPYSPEAVQRIRGVSGRKWIPNGKPKHWHVPLDMNTCRQLREQFGSDLVIGPALFDWAKQAAAKEASLASIASAASGELARLPEVLPTLHRAIHVGPIGITFTEEAQWEEALAKPGSYQAADVRFLVDSPAPLNGNEQGTGKTPEWIAAVWEMGAEVGAHLIVCPMAAVDGTWEPELEKWQADAPCEVGIFALTGSRTQREKVLEDFRTSTAPVKWVVVNPEMVRYAKDKTRTSKLIKASSADGACRCDARKDSKPHEHYVAPYPILFNTEWRTLAIDECHKNSIRNHRSMIAWSLGRLRISGKRIAMSGTPMKKRGADLWGILNWLRPDVFTSYWAFAGDYFEIEDNGFGKKVNGLRPERTDAFFRMLSPYMLRRLKSEVITWLPAKHHVSVWCRMGEEQSKAYRAMASNAVATLEGDEVSANGVLAAFTRLKQLATSLCRVDQEGVVRPTLTSCKVDAMLEKMDEAGMFDEGSTRKQVVFSQSRKVIDMVAELLEGKGLKVERITGGQTAQGQRRRLVNDFQKGDTRVLCVVTTAGGVSLTLDAADEAHFLDESWAPDEDQQAEDRIHRASRVHQVTIYNYRTHDTVDEYIMQTALDKAAAQSFIMDVRRKLLSEAK